MKGKCRKRKYYRAKKKERNQNDRQNKNIIRKEGQQTSAVQINHGIGITFKSSQDETYVMYAITS